MLGNTVYWREYPSWCHPRPIVRDGMLINFNEETVIVWAKPDVSDYCSPRMESVCREAVYKDWEFKEKF
jgi:hypothetical protein